MKYLDEFRNSEVARALVESLRRRTARPVSLMEVCGTHTVSIFKHGLRGLLPENVTMLSGPGCPVCVTPNAEIDKAIALARMPQVILTTFGDMMKVPGSYASLNQAKAEGADVRVVYSALDALKIARNNLERSVVFFGVGFETTAPTTAASILEAQRMGLGNFFFLSVHKVVPPAMKALLDSGEVRIDGFLCPGHVSTIIGSAPYEFIAQQYGIPCVIGGFEPLDILQALDMLLAQIVAGEARVEVQYRRAVHREGNPVALKHMNSVFEAADAVWRGLGTIPGSGLRLRPQFKAIDAGSAFKVTTRPPKEAKGCRCGDVLRGAIRPADCSLFGRACIPEHPIGPCMVSSEGTCSAWYLYGGEREPRED